MVGLFVLANHGEGLSANGIVWLTSSHSDTSVHWGLFLNGSPDARWLMYLTNALRLITPDQMIVPIGDPFVLGIRTSADAFSQEVWVNGVLAMAGFSSSDGYTSQGVDIGRNWGDGFFDMPSMRVSNVAAWDSRLSDADFVAVQESLMDAPIMAGAWSA
jgi:hypothetical protein